MCKHHVLLYFIRKFYFLKLLAALLSLSLQNTRQFFIKYVCVEEHWGIDQ